jgi:phosphate-selective porin OprO and OprP
LTEGRFWRHGSGLAATMAVAGLVSFPAFGQTSVQDEINQLKHQMELREARHDKEVKLLQGQIQSQHKEVELLRSQIRSLQQKQPAPGNAVSTASGKVASRSERKPKKTEQVSGLQQSNGGPAVSAPGAPTPEFTAPAAAPAATATGAVVVTAPPASAPAPVSTEPRIGLVAGRPTITSADGQYTLSINSLIQFDSGGYFQGTVPGPDNRQTNGGVSTAKLNNGYNLRRGFLGINGRIAGDWTYAFTGDFGGTPDGTVGLNEANINYVGFNPVIATLGYFTPPYTLADSTGARNFLFLEQPSITEIARSLAAGTARASFGARASGEKYFAGAYFTGSRFGANTTNGTGSTLNGEQTGGVMRLVYRPFKNPDWTAHFGFSGSAVFGPNFRSSGVPGVSQSTLTLQDQPELRIDPSRLISTGAISANGAQAFGPELAFGYRNFLVEGEFQQIYVNQYKPVGQLAPTLGFNGGYAEVAYVLTGEPIPYNESRAAFASPTPDRPFSLKNGGWGAWELAARFSTVDLNSHVVPGLAQTTTGGVYGGQQTIYTVGLNWFPNDNLRFMLDFYFADINRLNTAGTTQIGQRFAAIALRSQLGF